MNGEFFIHTVKRNGDLIKKEPLKIGDTVSGRRDGNTYITQLRDQQDPDCREYFPQHGDNPFLTVSVSTKRETSLAAIVPYGLYARENFKQIILGDRRRLQREVIFVPNREG